MLCVAAVLLFASGPNLADRWVVAKYEPQAEFERTKWLNAETSDSNTCVRQFMIRDLIKNVIPEMDRDAIETLLGKSPTHEEMRRHSQSDFSVREKDEVGNWKPYPRTGDGHYFDEFDWDLIYPIGREQILIYDHKGQELSPDQEHLIIRLDCEGRFESWCIDGSNRWRQVLGAEALQSYRRNR